MKDENKKDLPSEDSADGTPSVPESLGTGAPEVGAEPTLEDLLGEATERKPNHWEQQEQINENLPGFAPPPKPEAGTEVIDPDKILRKHLDGSMRPLVSAKSKFMAGMIIEAVDVSAPWSIAKFIAKDDNSDLYSADDDMKKEAKEATARYLGEKNVEVSPFAEMIMAISMMYAEPVMNAMHTAKLQKELQIEKNKNAQLEKRDKEREQRERDVEDLRQKRELEELRLQVANLGKQAAKKTAETQQIITAKKAPARRQASAKPPKKQNVEN
jgi:hypothetical protein